MSINKQLKLWVRANTMDQMVCTVRHVVVHKARYVDDIVVMTPTPTPILRFFSVGVH